MFYTDTMKYFLKENAYVKNRNLNIKEKQNMGISLHWARYI